MLTEQEKDEQINRDRERIAKRWAEIEAADNPGPMGYWIFLVAIARTGRLPKVGGDWGQPDDNVSIQMPRPVPPQEEIA